MEDKDSCLGSRDGPNGASLCSTPDHAFSPQQTKETVLQDVCTPNPSFSQRHEVVKGNLPPLEPIAIVGFGLRLPGGVHNGADYWDLLVNGKSGRCRVPASRYNVSAWHDPGHVLSVASEYGYYLDNLDLAAIDASFWSMTRREAAHMDPQQRLFLEVVYEALETAGARNWRGQNVGVYVGTMGGDWGSMEQRDNQNLDPRRAEVFGDYILANRASFEFDLRGPR
jgi:acyl transferase domain-containing protein